MKLSHPAWRVIAWLLAIANLVSVGFTLGPTQPWWHPTLHAVLALLFAWAAWRLTLRARST